MCIRARSPRGVPARCTMPAFSIVWCGHRDTGKSTFMGGDDVLAVWCVCASARRPHLQWSLYFLCWVVRLPLPPEATGSLGWYLDHLNLENNDWDGFFFFSCVSSLTFLPLSFTLLQPTSFTCDMSPLQITARYNFQISAGWHIKEEEIA